MSHVVEVQDVCKSFGRFSLEDVNFGVKRGFITGLIGPNGAGKSTIIKMMMDMVRPDKGSIRLLGGHPSEEPSIKDRVGYVSDENIYYEHLTIGRMKTILAPFYKQWDEDAFRKYLELFELSPKTKIKNLSKGMKMKFSLAVALSHHADLLIMDEPTAGLDPVFRRELLDLLSEQILDDSKSILFSTHITTDLDKIADYIIFLNAGQVVFSDSKEEVLDRYVLIKGGRELLDRDVRKLFVGVRESSFGFEALCKDRSTAKQVFQGDALLETPTLEDIMYFTSKGGKSA
ncbi:ABC transporter ATP-binding protein [Paenibacillus sp. HN-1]|uniref:ABC transporter ATP-binding protein n=1 Tax=Paenibacillus TaxID=44249 RepID=UPI001CA85834|nr:MULTISPECIES: ABC transporter ATP-binding protein [Paenibacillus]MBY9078522.1 ABC transporter ATP-binding protein [Paenibacillus sp. CGMCC 1.18879]MBY9082815.1 ABC transporter ATP-binding protein [Paenibacillus sinensis]